MAWLSPAIHPNKLQTLYKEIDRQAVGQAFNLTVLKT